MRGTCRMKNTSLYLSESLSSRVNDRRRDVLCCGRCASLLTGYLPDRAASDGRRICPPCLGRGCHLSVAVRAREEKSRREVFRPSRWPLTPVLLLGVLALAGPAMADVARESWTTEQGAHGPLVLAIGFWLLGRERRAALELARPGSAALVVPLFVLFLPFYIFARVTGTVEFEGAALCGLLFATGLAIWGGAALRRVWFPLVFLLFAFPPPDTLFAMLTQPLKIAVSQWAVALLHGAGYPIAGSGVSIQIGQYEMLVAAACAGMNSLISLTALGLFYVYIRHSANWRYMLLLLLFILPVAVLANLVRVLLLLLITYHFGEAAGQGFFHEAAGMTMFMTALLGIFAVDSLAAPLRRRLAASVEGGTSPAQPDELS